MAGDLIRDALLEVRRRDAEAIGLVFGAEHEPPPRQAGSTGVDQGARGSDRPERPIVDDMIRLAARRRRLR